MARRRIKKAKIDFISLCPRGANGFGVIYKDDDSFTTETVIKESPNFDEQGELVAVVYAPETEDSQGDIASAQVIKEAMHDAAKRGEGIDIRHDGKALAKDAAYVAERFEIQKGDPRFVDFTDYSGKKVDVTGGWGTVIKIDDPALRKEYRDGKWNGVSMGGSAMFETMKSDETVEGFVKALHRVLGKETNDSGDLDMDATELTTIMEKNNKSLATSIVEGLVASGAIKKAETAEEKNTRLEKEIADLKAGKKPVKKDDAGNVIKKDDEAPAFEGDMSKPADVKKHATKMKVWVLQKEVDWADPESVANYQEGLEAIAKEGKGSLTPEQEQIKKLEDQITKIKGGSNRQITKAEDEDELETGYEGMSKEDVDLFKIGQAMADGCNKDNGSFVEQTA